MHHQRGASEAETEREREAARWQWDWVGGWLGREKETFFSPFVLFCFTQLPKRIGEQIHFWTKAGLLKWKPVGGREVAPLRVTTEWSHDATALSRSSHTSLNRSGPARELWFARKSLKSEQEEKMGYTIPLTIWGISAVCLSSISVMDCDKTGWNAVSPHEKRAERSTACGFHIELKSFLKAWLYEKVVMQKLLNGSWFGARDQNNAVNNDRKWQISGF